MDTLRGGGFLLGEDKGTLRWAEKYTEFSMSCMAGYAGCNSEDLVKYLVHYLVITVCCAIHYIPLTVISYINGPWTILMNSVQWVLHYVLLTPDHCMLDCTLHFILHIPDHCTLYTGLYVEYRVQQSGVCKVQHN